jgi:NAD(P)-dependent dehydrogenase (short-subunit alcohol dehydrogenase family)
MQMKLLEGKVVIITGANSGIGEAAAHLFASEGAKLVLAARRKPELDAVVKAVTKAGGAAVGHAGDVSEEATAEALVALAVSKFGKLDAAFNNAGVLGEAGPSTGVSLKGWNEAFAINLTSAFLSAKHQVPAMQKAGGGAIVFTSSFLGHTASFPGVAAYAASKSGLIGLTQTLAVEFGPQNIRVNALLPGASDTPMYRAMNGTAESQSFVSGLHALKRVSQPTEIAKAALYLLSDLGSFTTGTAMLVDGGVSINRT